MNRPLPSERDVPHGDEMIAAILAAPVRPRRRWPLVLIAGIVLVAMIVAGSYASRRMDSVELATPSSAGSTVPGPSSSASTMTVPAPSERAVAHEVAWPDEWTALLEQHQMAAPPAGTGFVEIVGVGPDGQVITRRDIVEEVGAERVLSRQVLESSGLDRSDTVVIQEWDAGSDWEVGDVVVDGDSLLFTQSRYGVVLGRYQWHPGMSTAELVDEPAQTADTTNSWPAMAHLQGQADGIAVWFNYEDGGYQLVTSDGASFPTGPVKSLAVLDTTVWLLLHDGTLDGYDIGAGTQTATPTIDLPPPVWLASDGQTMLYIHETGIERWLNQGPGVTMDATSVDILTSAQWQVSGKWASWCQNYPNIPTCYLMDLTTGAYTSLPTTTTLAGESGVSNGFLVYQQDDGWSPAVVPLDALGNLQ